MALMKKVEKITGVDYEVDEVRIPEEYLMSAIEDLMLEIEMLHDKIAAMEDDIEENYQLRERNPYAELGLRESDFY